jgi:hypothetical protein
MLKWTRQRFPLYQVKCRAEIDMLPYIVLCWVFPSSWHVMAAFKIWDIPENLFEPGC